MYGRWCRGYMKEERRCAGVRVGGAEGIGRKRERIY